MNYEIKYDLFFSFSSGNNEEAKFIYEELQSFGLTVFWSDHSLKEKAGKKWSKEITNALMSSQNFLLLCTPEAVTSEWVNIEVDTFHNVCHVSDPNHRLIYVFKGKDFTNEIVPTLLQRFEYVEKKRHLIQSIYKNKINLINKENKSLQVEFNELSLSFKKEQKHFLYNKFWSPIVENKEIHIFTCARDTEENKNNRGHGGRTNIDKWDFTTVLEITHFLALKYPRTEVVLEPPKSKISTKELHGIGKIDTRDEIISKIRNKNCIIVGSPDVSDYAEIILAKLHNIEPYNAKRLKSKGYVVIKNKQHSASSFYWQKKESEYEGVAEIVNNEIYRSYKAEKGQDQGKMYGILTVANNPFVDEGESRKIIILSGFSGISTYSLSKFVTDNKFQEQLSKFDKDHVDRNKSLEVLIGVDYNINDNLKSKDNRNLNTNEDSIFYCGCVEI